MASTERSQAIQSGEGIFRKGYGTVAKLVMQDRALSIESKAIYSYLCTFAGNKDEAYPSVAKMIFDLNISKDRFYKHMNALVKSGYISKYGTRDRKTGLRHNNVYEINLE